MVVHQQEEENEVEELFFVESLGPYSEQAVGEMVESEQKDAGAGTFCQSTRTTGLEGSSYGRVFREDELMECPVFRCRSSRPKGRSGVVRYW